MVGRGLLVNGARIEEAPFLFIRRLEAVIKGVCTKSALSRGGIECRRAHHHPKSGSSRGAENLGMS